jgi:predicted anti-sigma-YlaC factor YlaD
MFMISSQAPAHARSPSAPVAPITPITPAAKPPDMSFDLLAPQAAIDPEAAARIEAKAQWRRKLLLTHQYLGYALLATLTATTILGQLNFDDMFYGNYTQRYAPWHEGAATASLLMFGLNGLLALAAPTPYAKALRFDTAMAHRILMGAATVGMVVQTILGIVAAGRAGRLDERDDALTHLVLGYVTYGLTVGGALVYVF